MSVVNCTILIASMRTSPAALTEKVWALAHQKRAKMPQKESLATQKALMNGTVKGG